jgi:hypothetical protein
MSTLPCFSASRVADAAYWGAVLRAWRELLSDLAAAARFNLRVLCDRELWLLLLVQLVLTIFVYKIIVIIV